MRARGGCRLLSWKVRRGRVVVCPPRRSSVATFRWQHSVRVVVSSPRRSAVSSTRRRRRVVAASSPSSSSSRRRRVVSSSLSVPASILTGIPTVVVAVPVVAVSSVPASILISPPGPVVWVRSEEGKQCSDCGAAGRLRGCSDCEGPGGCSSATVRTPGSCSDCEGAWTTATVGACGGCSAGLQQL